MDVDDFSDITDVLNNINDNLCELNQLIKNLTVVVAANGVGQSGRYDKYLDEADKILVEKLKGRV